MSNSTKTEETAPEPRKRGRPKDSFKPREIFVVCVGVYEGEEGPELACEQIQVEGDKTSTDSQLFDQAREIFMEKYESEPTQVLGPFFERKGQVSTQGSKRESINMDISQLRFSGKMAHAQYNDWNVSVQYIANRDDAAYVMFLNQVDSSAEKKKAKPSPKVVRLSALKNIREPEVKNA